MFASKSINFRLAIFNLPFGVNLTFLTVNLVISFCTGKDGNIKCEYFKNKIHDNFENNFEW